MQTDLRECFPSRGHEDGNKEEFDSLIEKEAPACNASHSSAARDINTRAWPAVRETGTERVVMNNLLCQAGKRDVRGMGKA